jgi:hypothetical protein
MQRKPREEGLRPTKLGWLEQARADRHGAQLLYDGGRIVFPTGYRLVFTPVRWPLRRCDSLIWP